MVRTEHKVQSDNRGRPGLEGSESGIATIKALISLRKETLPSSNAEVSQNISCICMMGGRENHGEEDALSGCMHIE